MTSTDMRPPLPAVPPASPPTPARTPGSDLGSPGGNRPRWARPAYVVLLLATAALYLVDLGANGWGNSFYAAAAQAGSESWSAFFYGASDAAGSITVDKTPLSLWPMALSVRLFGLSSWSLLVPQALMGVATVALLHRVVRRTTGSDEAALLAGATMALTPVAVLMFRFDNPDALLTLLLTGSAWATLRGVEAGRSVAAGRTGRPALWLALGGALVGLAFLTKMLQAFLVLPALALVYLLLAGVPLVRRLAHLLVAFGAMVVAGGWWVAVVELVPAGSRPYVGGSQGDSILELTLGYNGLGRLTGDETGSVGGGGGWGQTGLLRLFDAENGGQASWLVPAALLLGLTALACTRRHPLARASVLLWLGWLLVTGLTFSLMAGIFHAYYGVALAPAVAALVGTGAWALWQARTRTASALLGLAVAATASWAFVLLGRSADFLPWLRWVVLVGGLLAAVGLAVRSLLPRVLVAAAVTIGVLASLGGPAAYAVDTAATPHTGSIPSAGPEVAGGMGGPGGMPGMPAGGPGGTPGGGTGGMPGGGTGGFPGTPPTGGVPGGPTGAPPTGGTARGGGGLLSATTPSAELTAVLLEDADDYTWVAATVGAMNASGYQLATERSVMPIGGFNGSDPSPTLAEFQELVADGQVHWFLATEGGGMAPGGDGSSEITDWVEATFTATTVDGTTLYDLSGGTA